LYGGGFVIAVVLLAWIGYHFAVRTLRFVTVALAAAAVVLITRYGVTQPTHAPSDLVNAFTRGADEVSAAFFRPLLPGRHIPVPGRIGWLVIIVVIVFAYRELEVWAMRWQPPAVDTSALGGDEPGTKNSRASAGPGAGTTHGQRHDRLVAELRFRLPAVEVRAPAILPGGSASNGLASIAENSGVAGGGLAGAILRFVGMLWPNPRRYQVRVWIERDRGSARNKGGSAASTRVTVDLEDPRTGASIATKTLVASELEEAASVVAAYVARQIFGEDPTAPPWCVGSFDGDDLAAMLFAGRQRVSIESEDDVCRARLGRIRILEKSVSNNVGAGVARYELAQLHDIERNHVEALRFHAINREQYPRFYRGRYRLGMSLEMIANPEFGPIDEKDADRLDETLSILGRCGVTDDTVGRQATAGRHHVEAGQLSAGLWKQLLTAAANELCTVRRQLTLWRVIWAMFWHRDERAIRRPYWRLRERQGFHDGARVAELLVAVRQTLSEEGCARKDRRLNTDTWRRPDAGGPHPHDRSPATSSCRSLARRSFNKAHLRGLASPAYRRS
jgi:hypothetical protein